MPGTFAVALSCAALSAVPYTIGDGASQVMDVAALPTLIVTLAVAPP